MTQAQQQAISDAATKYFAAVATNDAAQAAAKQADADYNTAENAALALQRQQPIDLRAAADAAQKALDARTAAFAASGATASAMRQALLDYQQAIADSQQTGAVEDVSHTSQPLT